MRAEAILDAAMAVLAAEGSEGLTLQRVAQVIDYVPAALYRYFPSKDALLAALQRRAVELLHARFVDDQAQASETTTRAAEKVVALAAVIRASRFYLALPRREPAVWHLVSILLGDPRRLISDAEAARTAPLLLAFLAEVAGLFARAGETGGLKKEDPRARTLAFWATLHGIAQLEKLRLLAPTAPSVDALGRLAVDALLLGWGAEAPTLRAALRLVEQGS